MDFFVSDYVRENYLPDFGQVRFTNLKDGMEVPYGHVTIAWKDPVGVMTSLLTRDQGKPWEETIARLLIEDKRAEVVAKTSLIDHNGDGHYEDAISYKLPVRNPKCCIFQPTVFKTPSGACNTEYTMELELVFQFDDGGILPVRKTCTGRGSYSLTAADHMRDLLDDLADGEPRESLEEFFEDVPNAIVEDDELTLVVSGRQNGITDIEFFIGDERQNAAIAREEIMCALCSVRIIDFCESITDEDKESRK